MWDSCLDVLTAACPRARLLTLVALIACATGTLQSAGPAVSLAPGDDLQGAVAKNPAGTQFHLKSGTYRLQQITPKDGDSFVGEGAATILNGAVVLTRFEKSGNVFTAQFTPAPDVVHGNCTAGAPLCSHTIDCFLDNKPLRRVANAAELSTGVWFVDSVHHTIVLGDDPAGHTVEISTSRAAFSGSASNVTITGLTVEKYAAPAQAGAIGNQTPGSHWQISQCLVQLNHGAGIMVSDDSIVRGNRVLQNGQLGVAGHGKNLLIEDNEIASNNYAGFDAGWEGGGTKFFKTSGLRALRNNVHGNQGPGLWTDTDNTDTVYDSNTVTDNAGEGIKHEISFTAKITGNTVSGNGRGQSVWLWGAQILIQNSSGADVSGNKVIVPAGFGNGIAVIVQHRDSYVAKDNRIHDNDITYLDPASGASGIACDYTPECDLAETNHFEGNRYHEAEPGRSHWFWLRAQTWEQFREHGMEPRGSVDNAQPNSH